MGQDRFRAIAVGGVLKPVEPVELLENQQFEVFIRPLSDDIPSDALGALAAGDGGFDFLADPREDIYDAGDGEDL